MLPAYIPPPPEPANKPLPRPVKFVCLLVLAAFLALVGAIAGSACFGPLGFLGGVVIGGSLPFLPPDEDDDTQRTVHHHHHHYH